MKRVPLYSRSHRPTEAPAEPAAAAPDPGAAPAKPGRWAALARHERRLWALLILCLGVAFWWSNPTFRAKPPLTIEQIDAAIRQSIEDKPRIAPESRAYDAIIPSVVRVLGLMTDGDQPRVVMVAAERVFQPAEIVVVGAVDAHRMDAERIRQPVRVRQRAHGVEVRHPDGGNDDRRYPGVSRPAHRVVAVGVELGGVEVAVGVDPQRRTTGRP